MSRQPLVPPYDPFFPAGCDPFADPRSQDEFDAKLMAAARPSTKEETITVTYPPGHPLEHDDRFAGQRFDAEPPDPNESWDQELRDCPPAAPDRGHTEKDDLQQAAA